MGKQCQISTLYRPPWQEVRSVLSPPSALADDLQLLDLGSTHISHPFATPSWARLSAPPCGSSSSTVCGAFPARSAPGQALTFSFPPQPGRWQAHCTSSSFPRYCTSADLSTGQAPMGSRRPWPPLRLQELDIPCIRGANQSTMHIETRISRGNGVTGLDSELLEFRTQNYEG